MCVAVPGQITWIGEQTPTTIPARLESVAGPSEIDLVMVPQAQVGDYVIAHSGYAIRLLGPEQAGETLRLLGNDTGSARVDRHCSPLDSSRLGVDRRPPVG